VNHSDEPVSTVMRTEFASVASKERLDLADDVMKLGRIRHLPVVDGRRLVGVVSQRDLLAAGLSRALDFGGDQRRSFMRSVEVAEVMAARPITVQPGTTLREAALLMVQHQIGCLPVVDEAGGAVGLVTETDLLRAIYEIDAPAPPG